MRFTSSNLRPCWSNMNLLYTYPMCSRQHTSSPNCVVLTGLLSGFMSFLPLYMKSWSCNLVTRLPSCNLALNFQPFHSILKRFPPMLVKSARINYPLLESPSEACPIIGPTDYLQCSLQSLSMSIHYFFIQLASKNCMYKTPLRQV